jgi:hypothetical protein
MRKDLSAATACIYGSSITTIFMKEANMTSLREK